MTWPAQGRQSRPPTKRERFLAALLHGPRDSRQLQGPPVHDHVAHSTAAELRALGVQLVSERIKVTGFAGLPCWIARYSIRDDGRAVAAQLLEQLRERRIRGRR